MVSQSKLGKVKRACEQRWEQLAVFNHKYRGTLELGLMLCRFCLRARWARVQGPAPQGAPHPWGPMLFLDF